MSTLANAKVPVAPPPPPPPLPLPPHARAPAAPPLPISLADRVARVFPPLACVRGFRYFKTGRVEVVTATDVTFDTVVKGKRVQKVRLRIEEGRCLAACTCCAKLMGPAACKHVWATLLEVDRRGAFESLRATQRAMTLGVIAAAGPTRTKAKPTAVKGPATKTRTTARTTTRTTARTKARATS